MLGDDGINLCSVTTDFYIFLQQTTLSRIMFFVFWFVGFSSPNPNAQCHLYRGSHSKQLQDPTAVAEFAEILAKSLGTPLVSGLLSQVEGVTGRRLSSSKDDFWKNP